MLHLIKVVIWLLVLFQISSDYNFCVSGYQLSNGAYAFRDEIRGRGIIGNLSGHELTGAVTVTYSMCLHRCSQNPQCVTGQFAPYTNENTVNCRLFSALPTDGELSSPTGNTHVFYKGCKG